MKNAHIAKGLIESEYFLEGDEGGDYKNFTHPLVREVEPVVHEIAHAVSLGYRITKEVSNRISDYFSEINNRSPALGLLAEAHTFAIERHVLDHFGWLRYVRFGKIMRDVYLTGYSGPALPYRTLLIVYRRFLRENEIGDLVNEAIYQVHRISGVKAEFGSLIRESTL